MEDETRSLLQGMIIDKINNISSLETGSKEESLAIDNLTQLYKLKIEETKLDWDADEKYNRRLMENEQHNLDGQLKEKQIDADIAQKEIENAQKEAQLREQVKDRYFRIGAEAAGIILPLMFYATWMKKGFKFEESGTFTSTTFRGLFQKFKPTKK